METRKKRKIGNETFHLSIPSKEVSLKMSRVKSSGTSIEKLFAEALTSAGIQFSSYKNLIVRLEGKPDFILPKYKIAIFCDGDFWHAKTERPGKGANKGFWEAKLKRNKERDQEVNAILKSQGWHVLRFWEKEIKTNIAECIAVTTKKILSLEKRPRFTYVDLFSGIGGFRIALDLLGGKCLGFSEINKQSVKVYRANFIGYKDDEIELGDVTQLGKLPFRNIDLIVGGVPCQAWSIAGKNMAFDDPRGKLWEDAIRVIKENRPKSFIFENVKGLMDPRNSQNLQLIISTLEDAGYKVVKPPRLLNSFDFGLPQNRDRIFIVGFRSDLKTAHKNFKYPDQTITKVALSTLIDGIEAEAGEKKEFDPNIIHSGRVPASMSRFQQKNKLNDFFVFSDVRNGHSTIHSWEIYPTSEREKFICLTILKNRRKKIYGPKDGNPIGFDDLKSLIKDLKEKELKALLAKKILRYTVEDKYEFVNSKLSSGINGIYRIYLPTSKIFSTLTATGTKDFVATKNIFVEDPAVYKRTFVKEIFLKKNFRAITAKEAGRLQGFPDTFAIHETERESFKQFGNAVSTKVVQFLAKNILSALNKE